MSYMLLREKVIGFTPFQRLFILAEIIRTFNSELGLRLGLELGSRFA